MLQKKKKLSKKEIKEDRLISFYYKAYSYFDENKSRLLTYAGITVAVIVLIIFYVFHQKEQNSAAGIQLAQAMKLYDSGAYLEAIEGQAGTSIMGLKKIVDNYGSTENGETAKIYLANSYNFLGKPDVAYKYYKDYDGSIDLYKATSLAGQAGYFASINEFDKAADLYRKASRVTKSDVLNPDYILHAAINYINAGKKEEAKEMLDILKRDYNTTAAYRMAFPYFAQVD
jgi:tetratricopeptide (TPR) repeat protein